MGPMGPMGPMHRMHPFSFMSVLNQSISLHSVRHSIATDTTGELDRSVTALIVVDEQASSPCTLSSIFDARVGDLG